MRCIQVVRIKVAFALERRCRQGCPAIPSLFNLFIESLAQAIRQEQHLAGIAIGGDEYRVSLFADDDESRFLPPCLNKHVGKIWNIFR